MIVMKRLSETATTPAQAHPGDAGFDLYADESVIIEPSQWTLVKTNIAIALPYGVCAQVCPRSGLALKHGVTVLNAPGIIDNGYRDGIGVILVNHSQVPFPVIPGMRIAQLVLFYPAGINEYFQKVSVLPDSVRGENGFGSTGA
jgi:dUTP pyrophosphatase